MTVVVSQNSLEQYPSHLAAVRVLASVGHGEKVWPIVLVDEVLISKLFAVNGFTAGTIAPSKVTAL